LQADDDPEQHAFAGTASAQDGEGFTAAYVEGDAVQDSLRTERLGDILNDNRGLGVLRDPGVCRF